MTAPTYSLLGWEGGCPESVGWATAVLSDGRRLINPTTGASSHDRADAERLAEDGMITLLPEPLLIVGDDEGTRLHTPTPAGGLWVVAVSVPLVASGAVPPPRDWPGGPESSTLLRPRTMTPAGGACR